MAVLLFSMNTRIRGTIRFRNTDGATMDVILVGDRVIDSVGSEVEIGIQESYPNSTTQIISGDNLGLDDHLRFYEDGLTPWSIAFEEQSDFLILQPKSTDIAVQPESSGHDLSLQRWKNLLKLLMVCQLILFCSCHGRTRTEILIGR